MKKIGVTAWIIFLLANCGIAQCLSGDCQNGKGVLLYADGDRYIGDFWKSQKHGKGTFYYKNGSRYQGHWANDLPHGEGFKLFKDGTRLEGLWEKGRLIKRVEQIGRMEEYVARGGEGAGCISGDCRNGKGIYIYPSGAIYIGEFRNGEIHGVGVCYYSDGSKYQGEWMHRYPEGKGTKTYPDGRKRTGSWKTGQPVDQVGNLVAEVINNEESNSDGTEIQSGCITGDCLNGQGVFAYPNGSRYDGQFLQGKPEGWGRFHYIDGDTYIGTFKAGYPHGRGRMEFKDGKTKEGQWREGEYAGPLSTTPQPGCINGNCEDGYGAYLFRDGSKYVGAFKNFLPHGRGIVYYTNGERYEGEMAEAAFNGRGTLFLNDGSSVSGRWVNGAFAGDTASPGQMPDQQITGASPNKVNVWAVIIGVASYNHMPVLRYTDDDAYRIYAFLKSPEGGALDDSRIRILIDEDATKKNIVDAMENTFGQAGPNDLVLLYFSGHGLKGSFLPFDFDGYNNKLFHEEVNDILRKSPARFKLCIADACHSGSLLAMRGSAELPSLLSAYYENLAKAQPGTALIMSSKSDETSLESSGLRQGVFSHFLIRGLKGEADGNGNDLVTIQELYDFVKANVRTYTGYRQSPVIQGDYDKTLTVAVKR